MLHETGLLPRWYLPPADVREDLLEPSSTVTHCPFKGDGPVTSGPILRSRAKERGDSRSTR